MVASPLTFPSDLLSNPIPLPDLIRKFVPVCCTEGVLIVIRCYKIPDEILGLLVYSAIQRLYNLFAGVKGTSLAYRTVIRTVRSTLGDLSPGCDRHW
jgi:hypothetical protein